jgi:hypothetical protein
MSKATIQCPSCGAQTSGKFCSECGAPLAERACPACGAKLSARAKFCSECGSGLGGSRSAASAPAGAAGAAGAAATATGEKLPWIVAGVAVLTLIAVVIVVATRGRSPDEPAAPAAFDPNRATTDLTQMTPRQAADRLFDRVARASEGGDSQQVSFFGPMTLQAYADLPELDPDARLHIGLVHLALNQPASARAQADTIAQVSRTHLFASLLRARAAEAEGNTTGARAAFREYLANYPAERAKNLPEYSDHATMLLQTRDDAERAAGAASSPQ